MYQVSDLEIENRLSFDNSWWEMESKIPYGTFEPRAYLPALNALIAQETPNRAVVLMGPRRVGKTVMIHHAIKELISFEIESKCILYVSLDTPVYTGLPLEKIISIFSSKFDHNRESKLYIFFDEIQYLKDWEIHLKSLVDSYPCYKFVATGSAAAALKLKSHESGAGRFTDFMLPPLTFSEFLSFSKIEDQLIVITETVDGAASFVSTDIEILNQEFINYLNYGGYPEAVIDEQVKSDPNRFIKRDIIDKVLLRDLPSLYGIDDIQDLNRLFTVLAYNSGGEVSIDEISKTSGIAKNTIRKYLEYLEAAFLIRRVNKVDKTCKQFKRVTNFKVYLTNPSMRSALFGPVKSEDEAVGRLAETAIFSQWLHSSFIENIYYARWKTGEVDIVALSSAENEAMWAVEVKWSDLYFKYPEKLKSLFEFVKNKRLDESFKVTSLTAEGIKEYKGVEIEYQPSSLYCYTVGRNVVKNINRRMQYKL